MTFSISRTTAAISTKSSFYNTIQWNTFRRSYATTIQVPIEQDKFFNREKEIKALTIMLNMEPQLSIVSGPVNSGKTSLLLKILKDLSENNSRPVLHLNLRERSFNTVNEFESSLQTEMRSWLDRFKEVAKYLNIKTEGYGFKLETSVRSNVVEVSPIERLNVLFKSMSKQLPPHSWWSGAQSPILFIDEASRMRCLLEDKHGHDALTNMFEWFVMNTKETHRFHVILGSSDSFFHLWVQKYIGASRFTSYVIGDLPREDAKRFWNERVINQLNSIDTGITPPSFNDAYSACGGNMFLLKKYFSQYVQKGEESFEIYDFSLVGIERAKLINALFKNGNDASSSHTENGKPIWTREQFIEVMKKLVNSDGGFLIYEDLCNEIGQSVVDALIDYNLLHLRPSKQFNYDLPNYDATKSVLTAETRSSLVAMKKVLEDIEQGKI